jgi:hypothetical protein
MSIGGGGIGGILGGLLGNLIAPGLGAAFDIPALATEAGGSFLGSTIGGAASGEPIGKALLGGAEAGAGTAALGGLLDVATGTPLGGTTTPSISNLFGTGGTAAAPGTPGTAPAPVTTTPLNTGVTGVAPTAGAGAPAMGGFGGGIGGGGGSAVPSIGTPTFAGSIGAGGAEPFTGLWGGGGMQIPSFMESAGTSLPSPTGASATPLLGPSGGLGAGAGAITSSGLGAGGASTGGGGGLLGGDIGSALAKYGPTAISALGLGYEALKGSQPIPSNLLQPLQTGAAGLTTQAANLNTLGGESLSALQTGQIPPGAQAAIDQATSAAKAAIRSNYANLGETGSTMEAGALAQVDQAAATQTWNVIQGLTQTGLQEIQGGAQETNFANQIYTNILNETLQQDQNMQNALARFAAALAGGTSKATS